MTTTFNNFKDDGPFDWSEPLQGTILSCYFWGYFVSQIPGARVAEQFSAKYVMLFSVVINIVCTMLTPVMANTSYTGMIIMRIGEGIGGGVTFPAMHVMLASWAPPDERSVMASIVSVMLIYCCFFYNNLVLILFQLCWNLVGDCIVYADGWTTGREFRLGVCVLCDGRIELYLGCAVDVSGSGYT